jgi:glycosyltransferase involved in cell wall biosynthesis
MWNNAFITVVIPCYKVSAFIEDTVNGLPDWVDQIVLVNDASPDDTLSVLNRLAQTNPKVAVLSNPVNKGVGGAMVTGFRHALTTPADIVVKMDGDGQMNPRYLTELLQPISDGSADFAKGNRFNDFEALKSMPTIRRIGNLGLSFLIKAASGYWDVFDPSNGFVAISTKTLNRLDLDKLAPRYFFESSLLIELYYTGARIKDVAMPAIYGEEVSNLSVTKTLFGFPPKLFRALFRRILLSYFIYDFSITSVYMLAGLPLFVFGLLYGIVKWIYFASLDVAAPTGTVMLAVLPFILGFQMLLSAIQHDIDSKNPFRRN